VAQRVDGPERVRPGRTYSFSVHDLRPGARIRGAELTPTAHSGGNCCGEAVSLRARADAAGRATVRFRWPLHQQRCSGAADCNTYAWVSGQPVEVVLDVAGSRRLPETIVRIKCTRRAPGCTFG
jgi:hypothetical protein